MPRYNYEQADIEDRDAHLTSRSQVINKSGEADLWIEVIQKSINDIALFKTLRQEGKKLTEEEEEYEESAWRFIFDDEYRIPMDDYLITITCARCEKKWNNYVSKASGSHVVCPVCRHRTSWKFATYEMEPEQVIREMSLSELLSLFGINNLDEFRTGVKKRVEELIQKKKKILVDEDGQLCFSFMKPTKKELKDLPVSDRKIPRFMRVENG